MKKKDGGWKCFGKEVGQEMHEQWQEICLE